MNAKLHINIAQGVIDVEGDADLVREVYGDFRDRLLAQQIPEQIDDNQPDLPKTRVEDKPSKRRSKPKLTARKSSSADGAGNGILADAPKRDKNLDTSDLREYYNQFQASSHPEKILIFLKFLHENLGIEDPNTDQVYTCYESVSERVPKAFAQAFRDASGRKFGFIDFNSPTDIKITVHGNNYFKYDLKRKAGE